MYYDNSPMLTSYVLQYEIEAELPPVNKTEPEDRQYKRSDYTIPKKINIFLKAKKSRFLHFKSLAVRRFHTKLERIGCPKKNLEKSETPSWADTRCHRRPDSTPLHFGPFVFVSLDMQGVTLVSSKHHITLNFRLY